jgi:hypothetical protein
VIQQSFSSAAPNPSVFSSDMKVFHVSFWKALWPTGKSTRLTRRVHSCTTSRLWLMLSDFLSTYTNYITRRWSYGQYRGIRWTYLSTAAADHRVGARKLAAHLGNSRRLDFLGRTPAAITPLSFKDREISFSLDAPLQATLDSVRAPALLSPP